MTRGQSNPTDPVARLFMQYRSAHIDYETLFLKLYIGYNAWYREATGTMNDRQAIDALKKRFVIWDDYQQGRVFAMMGSYLERLCDETQRDPFPSAAIYWNGEVSDVNDWTSLIEFWYQVRCLVVHGAPVGRKYAWLAYETLDIFMGEIIERMHACFSKEDLKKLHSLAPYTSKDSGRAYRFSALQRKLYQKYVSSSDIWQVDMQRVGDSTR